MKIAVLGTGIVGNIIGKKLVEKGHSVKMGARSASNENAARWASETGKGASHGTFSEAAAWAEMIFNCTKGEHALAALNLAGSSNLKGKVLIDVSNPLDFSKGMPPSLTVCNEDSLGEQIQRAFSEARVVKTLNTVNCHLMVDASRVPGRHDIFLSGNDLTAKNAVREILAEFGWNNPIDLGDISTSRATEMYLPLWVRLYGLTGSADFNIAVIR